MTAAVQTAPTVDTSPAPVAPSPESVSPKPSRAVVLNAIMAETGCNRPMAGQVLAWVKRMVAQIRESGYLTYYPTDDELDSPVYRVFDAVMSHGSTAAPGSAHAKIEAHVLKATDDEFGLRHDMQEDAPGTSYCTVEVVFSVVR